MKKYQYIFGPIPSRRFGISLGIDIVPHKTCDLDCVYCECGHTNSLVIERKEFVPTVMVIKEIDDFLSANPKLDFITFSGSGEPTLHTDFGKINRHIKTRYPAYKTAILTNGSLLFLKIVRLDCSEFDVVKISLDAATPQGLKEINRPHSAISIENMLEGITLFSREFKNQIWIEIFIVPGINDTEPELTALKKFIRTINPTRIQLNTLDRPGTETWVKPATRERLEEIAGFLGKVEIISKFNETMPPESPGTLSIPDQIQSTIKRRPCTIDDLSQSLAVPPSRIEEIIQQLLSEKKISACNEARGTFYRGK